MQQPVRKEGGKERGEEKQRSDKRGTVRVAEEGNAKGRTEEGGEGKDAFFLPVFQIGEERGADRHAAEKTEKNRPARSFSVPFSRAVQAEEDPGKDHKRKKGGKDPGEDEGERFICRGRGPTGEEQEEEKESENGGGEAFFSIHNFSPVFRIL